MKIQETPIHYAIKVGEPVMIGLMVILMPLWMIPYLMGVLTKGWFEGEVKK